MLADRNPPWLADFADRMLRERWAAVRRMHWQVVRDLVRRGLIEKPEGPEYTTAMVTGIYAWESSYEETVLNALRADPGLLGDEVWRLFSVPEAAPELDRGYTGWDEALLTLAAAGPVDRGRLLDACLDVFISDFPPKHVGWYLRLHDQLAPSRDEKAARAGKYLALLSASSKAGLTLGQRECGALLDAGRLDPRAFLAASSAALLFPQKSAATAQLKLIGALIKARPELRDEALAATAAAFGHDREDVQAAALGLIKKHGLPADESARATVESLAAALSPVVAPDAVALGLVPAVSPPAAPLVPVDGRQSASTSTLPLTFLTPKTADSAAGEEHSPVPDDGFDGVADPGELVQLLARLIEDASDPLAVERAVAGAVRLASLPLAERARLAGPLLKRARVQCWREDATWLHVGTEAHLAFLTIAWATGELGARAYPERLGARAYPERDDEAELVISLPPEASHDPADWDPADPRHGVLGARLWEACQLILAGPGGPLLAEPELADGTISLPALLMRLTKWRPGSGGPPLADVESALLRLARGADDAFWSSWDAAPVVVAGEAPVAATARAMYDEGHVRPEVEPVFVPPVAAVGLNGHPGKPPRVFGRPLGSAGSPAPAPGSRCWQALSADPAGRSWDPRGWYTGGFSSTWELPLLLPHQPELVARHLLPPLSVGLTPGSHPEAREAAKCLSVTGTVPGSGFGRMGHLALVTALASGSADTRLAAAEGWTRAALDGRLDPDLAAAAITDGVSAVVLKLNRIAESLGQAALDPAATAGVADVCLAAAAALLPVRPPGLHLLLELAARCRTAIPAAVLPALPAPIAKLAASRDRTKLGEAARRLARLG